MIEENKKRPHSLYKERDLAVPSYFIAKLNFAIHFIVGNDVLRHRSNVWLDNLGSEFI